MRWGIVPLLLAASAAVAEKPRVVVLDLAAADGETRKLADLIAEQILTDLAGTSRCEVMGRSDLATLLGLERQKQLMGCSEEGSSCMAELADALGAQYVLAGSLAWSAQQFRLDLKLIDTTKARVLHREGRVFDAATRFAAVEAMARAIAAALPGAPVPVSVVPSAPVGHWLTIGGGVAAAGGGLALFALGQTGGADLRTRKETLTWSEANGRLGVANAEISSGSVLIGVGAAAVVAGLVWWLAGRPPGLSAQLTPIPGGVSGSVGGAL